jgi:hypothetical protein
MHIRLSKRRTAHERATLIDKRPYKHNNTATMVVCNSPVGDSWRNGLCTGGGGGFSDKDSSVMSNTHDFLNSKHETIEKQSEKRENCNSQQILQNDWKKIL